MCEYEQKVVKSKSSYPIIVFQQNHFQFKIFLSMLVLKKIHGIKEGDEAASGTGAETNHFLGFSVLVQYSP